MASLRMLPDTVKIHNYVGEKDRVATYQVTTIKNCYCPVTFAAPSGGNNGKTPSHDGDLYIFDFKSVATDQDGNARAYLPYESWKALQEEERAGYWTLNTGGKDFFTKEGHEEIHFKIARFTHLVAGSRRMWHFEVKGK